MVIKDTVKIKVSENGFFEKRDTYLKQGYVRAGAGNGVLILVKYE